MYLVRRVGHDVGAQGQRLLEVGRGEGVVDGEQCAGFVGHSGQGRDVGDAEERVGRGLAPDEPGLGADRRPYGRRIAQRRGGHRQAPAFEVPGEEAKGAAVGVVGDDDVVTGRADRVMTLSSAASPLANAKARVPASMAARHSSNAVREPEQIGSRIRQCRIRVTGGVGQDVRAVSPAIPLPMTAVRRGLPAPAAGSLDIAWDGRCMVLDPSPGG
jgi:hypothetical protein